MGDREDEHRQRRQKSIKRDRGSWSSPKGESIWCCNRSCRTLYLQQAHAAPEVCVFVQVEVYDPPVLLLLVVQEYIHTMQTKEFWFVEWQY